MLPDQSVSLFDREPFLRPDRDNRARRAQLPSGIAQQPPGGAEGVLDGSEHGATIIASGV